MKKKFPLVVGIGEILWDLLPDGRRLGGAPGNFAYHAAQQGAEAFVISAVGNDADGQEILDEFIVRNLSTQYLSVIADYPTGTVSVELNNGIPSYIIHVPVAWDFIPFSDRLKKLASQADAVCFGTLAQRNAISSETIKSFLKHTQPECLKVFDVNLRQNFYNDSLIEESLQICNILKISDEELPIVAELIKLKGEQTVIAAELISRYDLKYLVITRGKDGSILYYGRKSVSVAAYDYGPVVDTVGCGDSFSAVLVTELLLGFSPESAMLHATKVAGFVCANSGAIPEMPDLLTISFHET